MTERELEVLRLMAAKIAAPLLAQAPTPKEDGDYPRILETVTHVSVELARRIWAKTLE